MALNKIMIMGRIVRDIELRRTQSGVSVVSLTLAVDRDFKTKAGEREVDFIDVVAYRNTADFLAAHFGKGRTAVVDGRLHIRDWTDSNGNKRRSAEVVAENVYFGDSKKEAAQNNFENLNSFVEQNFEEIREEDTLPF